MNKTKLLHESFVFQFVHVWSQYWVASKTKYYGNAFFHTTKVFCQHSSIVQWMQTGQCCVTPLFRKSYCIELSRRCIFKSLERIVQRIQKTTNNSMVAHCLGVLHRDLEENGVSCICSFLFSFTVLWTLFTLFFGEGFSRTTLLVLFSSVIFFFTLSYIRIKPSILLQESKLWQWIKEIAQ
ncbi:MAG: hypothetical protein PHI40_02875 [Caldisericia bacterium]|nr:hypothetical protein [Caldisericia bacterium]MDD4614335.1 hypothetical protein [Caldisericia bacterium]